MTGARWVPEAAIHAIHAALVAEHGGAGGVRDGRLLQSALTRPRNKREYESPDLADLAAAYAFGICRNRPFVDGNKRVALAVADVFLRLNGQELRASEEDAAVTFRDLAAGTVDEPALAAWIRSRSGPLTTDDP